MPSRFHEWLIDQVTNVITDYPDCIPFRRKYPHVGGAVESVLPHLLMGLDMSRRADLYILGGDQADSPIFVEAGNMKPHDKWPHVTFSDGKPPRILRVCFDGGVYLLNPRSTEFERDLVDAVASRLQRVWHCKPC